MNTLMRFDEFFESKKIEIVNESNEGVTQEMFEIVEKSLPELEKLIKQKLGASINIKAKIESTRNGQVIKIYTDDTSVIKCLGSTIVKTLFQEIQLDFKGGEYIEKENKIWFDPKLKYTHPYAGSNGTDFVWTSLFFDLNKNKWVEGKVIF